MTAARLALGRAVEERTAAWYAGHGYVVLARNWRCREGEVDLIVLRRRDRLLVFCEVKARRSGTFGSAAEAVGLDKQARLRRLAAAFLAEAPSRAGSVRFDVATWDAGRFEILEGAF